ncbi:MAG: TAXI family TRAP transporter solute-binding subunit [Gammaproteobacteria bacterium]|nr:TAXI family TRAP transporter solute-binding subunit [Gammaproteobacteria bacterium]MBT5604202.1 TAXI family TRAP transporter solute-binding subunit [Gammaproteobacteria bacterium]
MSVLTLTLLSALGCFAQEYSKLPATMAWSAYNLGTTGYNQAVAIAKMLKDRHAVTLRVIPAKNDVSRLLPLRVKRVHFSANGVSTYLAQEGVFQFSARKWGPLPVRMVLMSVGFSNQGVAVPASSGITRISQLKGKRVPWVHGAPALNISTQAVMACGGLTWEDVERIDFPGYGSMWNAIVDGQIDAAYATTVSGPARKLEASPRGIRWLAMPHNDEACWQRVLSIAPYFTPHMATRGAAIDDDHPHEGGTYPYPILTALASQDKNLVYLLAKAIVEGFDDYKMADPGSIGWDINRQQFQWVVPFHDGSVEYFKQLGMWTPERAAHNLALIRRQDLLDSTWQEMLRKDISEDDAFSAQWYQLRAMRLKQAGFDPVWEEI